MKVSIACVVAILAAASANVLHTGHIAKDHASTLATPEFINIQKHIFQLLDHIFERSQYPEQKKEAAEFDFEKHIGNFSNIEAVTKFRELYSIGFLKRGLIFSILNPKHREQAISLFNIFYHSKDVETLYKLACWARVNINDGIFVYALTVAVIHHPLLRGIVLPAPYETNPYYFLNHEVINDAFYRKIHKGVYDESDTSKYGFTIRDKVHTIDAKRSGWYIRYNQEQQISYFTDDVGLNSYYYYFQANYPFWLGGPEFGLNKDRRGELYYFFNQQLSARYFLERLSNGLGEIPDFDWNEPIETGYYNALRYTNDVSFPSRPNSYTPNKDKELQGAEYLERHFMNIVSNGYIDSSTGEIVHLENPEDIEVLGNVMQSNPDSKAKNTLSHLHGTNRGLLGGGVIPIDDTKLNPSALEHFETSLRDPIFWQINQKLIRIFTAFKNKLPPYTKDELVFPGVKVIGVDVEKLFTFFDKFEWDFTNAVYKNKEEHQTQTEQFIFTTRQDRLNHQPFNVKIAINSEHKVKSVVRIFIGPKYDSYNTLYKLEDNHYNFFELDTFLYDLEKGENIIERFCHNYHNVANDKTPARDIYRHVLASIEGKEQFKLENNEPRLGFPIRLLLPKGTKGGFPFQFYVIVSPWIAPKVEYGTGFDSSVWSGVGTGGRYLDARALGYPFDRRVKTHLFYQPNMFWKDVSIYHKES